MRTFYLGNICIEVQNNQLNELREYVEEIQTKKGDGEDFSKHLSDFCFDVEASYQSYHGLHCDNWDMVHGEFIEQQFCKKYKDSEVLPDEDDNCSLCGGDCTK